MFRQTITHIQRKPKQILFFPYFMAAYSLKRLRRGRRAVRVTPGVIAPPFMLWKVFRLLGIRQVSGRDGDVDLLAHHEPVTFPRPARSQTPGPAAFNFGCTDTSKSLVNAVFDEVFTYPLEVDPLTYSGLLVEKSDQNSNHDGRIVQGPLSSVRDGFAYQRCVRSAAVDGRHEEYRLTIVGDEIPVAHRKYLPNDGPWKAVAKRIPAQPAELLDEQEHQLVIDLCRRMGVDVGEVDAVRDEATGQLYVFDVNQTPHAPPYALGLRNGIRAMNKVAESFERQFLSL
jgi:hypothetical protein